MLAMATNLDHGWEPARFVLDGRLLTLEALDGAYGRAVTVKLTDHVRRRIDAGAKVIDMIASGERPAYWLCSCGAPKTRPPPRARRSSPWPTTISPP